MHFRYVITSKYILLLLSAHIFYCCSLYFFSIFVSEIESVSVWGESFRSRLFCPIIQLTHVARSNVIDALTSDVGIASQAWIHSNKDKEIQREDHTSNVRDETCRKPQMCWMKNLDNSRFQIPRYNFGKHCDLLSTHSFTSWQNLISRNEWFPCNPWIWRPCCLAFEFFLTRSIFALHPVGFMKWLWAILSNFNSLFLVLYGGQCTQSGCAHWKAS